MRDENLDACREVVVSPPSKEGGLSTCEALAWFSDVLRKGAPKLPDFIYFTDDGVCQGALLAFLKYGVRIPEDVKVMSWSNNGRGPYSCDPIAYAQVSTFDNAAAVADNLLACLKGESHAPEVELQTELVRAPF